jgi:hypothetical protein
MTATVLPLRKGSGRQSAAAEAAWRAQTELGLLRDETLATVDAAWPHLSALHRAAAELGPVYLHHTVALSRLLHRLEVRMRTDDEPEAVAAA